MVAPDDWISPVKAVETNIPSHGFSIRARKRRKLASCLTKEKADDMSSIE
jgi:hypothetical protein